VSALAIDEGREPGGPDPTLQRWCESRDPDARRRLIEQHLPLVRALARRYASRGEQVEDLVQVGAVGLIKAVDRFEPGRGSSLSAYAAPTILGEIRRHLRDSAHPVRVPRARWEVGEAVHAVPLEADSPLARDTDAERRLERGEDRALIAASLRTLGRREREIVRLRYYGGLSQRGIAARLGLSQVHVSRLLAQSLRTLRQEIGRTEL
jgi:RNA polymerase sigma-B factor